MARTLGDESTRLHCSFCGRRRPQVDDLIAAPQFGSSGADVAICDECATIAHEIVQERRALRVSRESPEPQTHQNDAVPAAEPATQEQPATEPVSHPHVHETSAA